MSNEYSAVAAKLRTMHARFLTEGDYEELLGKKSVADVCAYLKTTEGYMDVLDGVNEREMHRGVMELLLEQDIMDEYVRLYNFVDKGKRDLLKFWFVSREIEFLKREIRYIYTHDERSADAVNQGRFDAFFETHTRINRELMQNASSLSDCAAACEGTPYAAVIQRAENIGADFFTLGMLFDTYYYVALWRAAGKRLDGEQRSLLSGLIGAKTDMLNLMWIYRCKKYYNVDSDIIFTYLLPIHHRINDDALRQLVAADGADKFAALAGEITVYGGLFDGLDNGRFPEENFRVMYNSLSKRIFVNHSESFAAICAYLNLKEVELNNITTITEGIRYNLNTESIRQHIGI